MQPCQRTTGLGASQVWVRALLLCFSSVASVATATSALSSDFRLEEGPVPQGWDAQHRPKLDDPSKTEPSKAQPGPLRDSQVTLIGVLPVPSSLEKGPVSLHTLLPFCVHSSLQSPLYPRSPWFVSISV